MLGQHFSTQRRQSLREGLFVWDQKYVYDWLLDKDHLPQNYWNKDGGNDAENQELLRTANFFHFELGSDFWLQGGG